ncbi:glycosyltransferase [Leuconostoc holzapfelii]|uniref:Glycosyltransferase n=1 Tax=Leuconostoc holzapfelii TaxID=434464 RepID=A0ABT2NSX5_9LACO|nr:glycosyltransferase [Leuconostoc holzapfelii]MCT8388490.1 glycosyltransferase [Leuconostoc holzapfelii]
MKNRILVISGVPYKDGGSNAALLENILFLRDEYEFLVIVPVEESFTKQLEQHKIKFKTVNSVFWRHSSYKKETKKRLLKKIILNFIADIKIYQIIKKNKIDLVHINVSAVGIGWLASKIAKRKTIWHLRELNDIDQDSPLDFPKISAAMFRRSTLVPISKFVYDYYKHYLGSNTSFNIISDGINTKPLVGIGFLPVEKKDVLNIGFLGGYQQHKGLGTVLESLAVLKEKHGELKFHLNVYGTQFEESSHLYKRQAELIGVSKHVTFHRFADNLVDVYSSSDIVISAGLEAFGRVVAETIVSGRIAIGVNQGATPELIQDGLNGYIFEQGNPMSLAEKLTLVADNWNQLVENIKNSRLQSQKKLSSDRTAENIGILYKNLINGTDYGKE